MKRWWVLVSGSRSAMVAFREKTLNSSGSQGNHSRLRWKLILASYSQMLLLMIVWEATSYGLYYQKR